MSLFYVAVWLVLAALLDEHSFASRPLQSSVGAPGRGDGAGFTVRAALALGTADPGVVREAIRNAVLAGILLGILQRRPSVGREG